MVSTRFTAVQRSNLQDGGIRTDKHDPFYRTNRGWSNKRISKYLKETSIHELTRRLQIELEYAQKVRVCDCVSIGVFVSLCLCECEWVSVCVDE